MVPQRGHRTAPRPGHPGRRPSHRGRSPGQQPARSRGPISAEEAGPSILFRWTPSGWPVRFAHCAAAAAWRQLDLGARAGFSRGVVAEIEQGRGDRVTVATLDRIAEALGARVYFRLEWQGENLDRLLDAAHARLVEQIVRRLGLAGWACATEASFSVFGERGSIDVLAYHVGRGVLLVVEAKSTLPDVGGMLMTLDRKTRLAPAIARDRGWAAQTVARLLVITDSGTARRRIAAHRATFEAAFPLRGRAMTRWLSEPQGGASGLWFLPGESQAVTSARSRVRSRRGPWG